MPVIYRVTRLTRVQDLSGKGSVKFPGRWNRSGHPVIYCAESVAGAYLEVLAYLSENPPLPNPAVLAYIQIPDTQYEQVSIKRLNKNWMEYPYSAQTKDIGCAWLKSKRTLALRVPSALAPDTFNILLNPLHKDFTKVKILKYHPIKFDLRFFSK